VQLAERKSYLGADSIKVLVASGNHDLIARDRVETNLETKMVLKNRDSLQRNGGSFKPFGVEIDL
jgi:DNA repair exonuclease SbcCD nuclease subunit